MGPVNIAMSVTLSDGSRNTQSPELVSLDFPWQIINSDYSSAGNVCSVHPYEQPDVTKMHANAVIVQGRVCLVIRSCMYFCLKTQMFYVVGSLRLKVNSQCDVV